MTDFLDGRLSTEVVEDVTGAFRDGRLSAEILEDVTGAFRDGRLDIEALYSIFVTLLDARLDTENLWQQPTITLFMTDGRLSVEVLEGPVLNKSSWGMIPII